MNVIRPFSGLKVSFPILPPYQYIPQQRRRNKYLVLYAVLRFDEQFPQYQDAEAVHRQKGINNVNQGLGN